MGLLSMLFGEGKKTPSIVKSNGGGTFSSYAIGHRHHQDALKRIFSERTSEINEKLVEAVLVIDDGNQYDNQAVRVDIQGQTVAYLKDENAKQFRKKMREKGPSEIKATCAAKIVYWERESDNYLVILDLPLDYQSQPSYPAPSTVTYEKEATGSEMLTLEISNLDPDELAECHISDRVKLWMPPDDADKIFLYIGNWRLAFIAGKYFELVASHLNKKLPYEANVTELAAGRCRIKCKLISQEAEEKRKQERRKDITSSVEYSPIDEDIYKCFISNKTGMCDEIGTWEQFQNVEKQIEKICQANNGKYYKSKAKTAKFAIIFDPAARTLSNVTILRSKGYKVTTFEKTLEHFVLTDMWDCNKLIKAEKDYKKFMYEETFG